MEKFVYCYSEWQPLYEKMIVEIKNITFVKGLPDMDNLENAIVIHDDLMHEVVEDKNVLNLFTVGSHHRKISVIFLTHLRNIYLTINKHLRKRKICQINKSEFTLFNFI